MSGQVNFGFQERVFISGKLQSLTGMHIGGNSTEMGIGGADSIVVRDPVTNWPYIPGSSLRGKMRSLMERLRGEMTIKFRQERTPVDSIEEVAPFMEQGKKIESAGPASKPGQASTELFGISVDRQQKQQDEAPVPQRLVVRDAHLANWQVLESARNTEMPMTEVKTEVVIDRITSGAMPRQIERVPAGAEFDFEFVLNLYSQDDEQDFLDHVFQCMQLLQDDYLGGHGSRGYGRVLFKDIELKRKTLEDYRENRTAQAMDVELPEALRN